MDDYTIKLIEDGIFLLVYHTTVTEEVFRKAAEAQVEFAKTHIGGDYIIVVDYTEAMLKASAINFRLNSWAASVDPHMITAVLVSQNLLVSTAANLVHRVTGKNFEIFRTRAEALARARTLLAEHRAMQEPDSGKS